jgi:predicted transcriptional regulator
VPIGTTCRLCERMDCDQRAFPALMHGVTVDENVRGRSFYAPNASEIVPEVVLPVKRVRKR